MDIDEDEEEFFYERRPRAKTLNLSDLQPATERERSHSATKTKLFGNAVFVSKINKEKQRVHSYKTFHITVLGMPGVGKTCIIERFVNGHFIEEYAPTISESYETGLFLEMDNKLKQFDLVLHDFNGRIRSQYTEVYREEIHKADGFIVVHSKDKMDSFPEVIEIVADISNLKEEKPPILVLENKSDLRSENFRRSFHLEYATSSEIVSAKTSKNIQESIAGLVHQIENVNSK